VEISVDGDDDDEVLGIFSAHTYMLHIYLLLFFILTQAGLACHSTHRETFPSNLVSELSPLLSMNSPPAKHSNPYIKHVLHITRRLKRLYSIMLKVQGKAIPVAGRGGPQGCEMLRLPHFLDNWLTDGGKVVSLTLRPHLYPQENSWYSFLLEAELSPGT
jgi:hypothetical protein